MENGLTSSQASQLLKQFGYNEIPEKKVNVFKKIAKNVISPIGIMLLFASLLSFTLQKTFDGCFILILLVLNIFITLWQESKADNAIKKLNEHLEQNVKVYRDNSWQTIPSRMLVPGDTIKIASGDVIPADGKIIQADHISINESAITGESLPKDKKENDVVFSGSFLATGIATIVISATGPHTNFGKTLFSVERVRKKSLLEKDIISISKFLTILSLIAVGILTTILFIRHESILELLTLDLSLIIAGIPISLPTVMTLIIEFGVLTLAKKNIIVRRLSALEDLANVNFLLTDKTGTLTNNAITIQDIYAYDGFTHIDVLMYAGIIAAEESDNPIDQAILKKITMIHAQISQCTKSDFIPADSERKRSTLIGKKNDKTITISMGAPQIIQELCTFDAPTKEKYMREVVTLAKGGYRTIAVAVADGEKEEKMKIVGLLALSDTLRSDAKSVMQFLQENGIGAAIVTGDNQAIAANIAAQLGMGDKKIMVKNELTSEKLSGMQRMSFQEIAAFAEILPEDKFHLVEQAKKFFIVASNGDGVNDLPAIKAANVGIAVKNAVNALKATADIVLLSEGISVIRDALIESRKIFERIYTYSLYRISESLRLIATIAILGILYGTYPMTALQIILIALLNDIPIISLAFDKVKITNRPAKIEVKKRFILSSSYGIVGICTSLMLFFIVKNIWHLEWQVIQTMFFLKLTISGHMLIYVAHTKEHWWKFLPSKEVIWSTLVTQLIATSLAFSGFLMPGKLALWEVGFVWVWALCWMQVSELVKLFLQKKL